MCFLHMAARMMAYTAMHQCQIEKAAGGEERDKGRDKGSATDKGRDRDSD